MTAPLGALLAQSVAGLAAEGGVAPGAVLVLVPVPSRPAAVRARGRDAMLALVRAAARELERGGVPARAVPLLATRLPLQTSPSLLHGVKRLDMERVPVVG